jgi:hypothetical protein
LGVAGIRQGEIVSYKKEVNFILYASDTVSPNPVRKATDKKLSERNPEAYAAVSIFVPSQFLNKQGEAFWNMLAVPPYTEIPHGGFCVKEKRALCKCKAKTHQKRCKECKCKELDHFDESDSDTEQPDADEAEE